MTPVSGAAAIDLAGVLPAFVDPVREAQTLFRRIMEATARPGRIEDLSSAPDAPDGLDRAAGGVALTLFDFETPVWLDPALRGAAVEGWLRFHCGCPLTEAPERAAFAVVTEAARAPDLAAFDQGDAKYPDRSTTVVLRVEALSGGPPMTLTGPGIKGATSIAPLGLPVHFWRQFADNNSAFQFGVDVLLVAGDRLMALPRSARAVPKED